jgi:hypothetical protein
MLKLEDFKINEVKTLESITGGGDFDTIVQSTSSLVINGIVIATINTGGDWCSGCDVPPQT